MDSEIDFKEHWDKAHSSNPVEKMGWYEKDVSATFRLIEKSGINADARILNVGAGSTTLVDELLANGYSNMIASDLSEVSLDRLKARLGDNKDKVKWIVDDLTNSSKLKNLEPVHLWIDRAVLHFFSNEADRKDYFDLLRQLIKPNGYAMFAEYSLEGALKCAGLDVYRYSNNLLIENLGDKFELVETFDFTYTMPSGALRPYIYSLFKRVG